MACRDRLAGFLLLVQPERPAERIPADIRQCVRECAYNKPFTRRKCLRTDPADRLRQLNMPHQRTRKGTVCDCRDLHAPHRSRHRDCRTLTRISADLRMIRIQRIHNARCLDRLCRADRSSRRCRFIRQHCRRSRQQRTGRDKSRKPLKLFHLMIPPFCFHPPVTSIITAF